MAVDCVATSRPGFSPFCGTSAAAPHVAAIAALLLSQNPGLTPAQVRAILKNGSVDLGVPGFDTLTGAGRLDAVQAVDAVSTVAQSTLDVQLNATSFVPGQTIGLSATLTPGLTLVPVDAYVVLAAPGDAFFSVQLGGAIVPGVVPIVTGLTPFAFSGQLLLYTFTGGEPPGPYRVLSGLASPGTLTAISGVAEDPFTLGP